MRRIRITIRRPVVTSPPELDLRSPSGRELPY